MCPFTKEDGLKSKNARKQTSFEIQFYIGIEVTSFDFQQFYLFGPNSPSPSVHTIIAQLEQQEQFFGLY